MTKLNGYTDHATEQANFERERGYRRSVEPTEYEAILRGEHGTVIKESYDSLEEIAQEYNVGPEECIVFDAYGLAEVINIDRLRPGWEISIRKVN